MIMNIYSKFEEVTCLLARLLYRSKVEDLKLVPSLLALFL